VLHPSRFLLQKIDYDGWFITVFTGVYRHERYFLRTEEDLLDAFDIIDPSLITEIEGL